MTGGCIFFVKVIDIFTLLFSILSVIIQEMKNVQVDSAVQAELNKALGLAYANAGRLETDGRTGCPG